MRKFLFLDIDGVIATEYDRVQLTEFSTGYPFTPKNLSCLYQIIEAHPEVEIILQTSWKDIYPTFQDLKYQFKIRNFQYLDNITEMTKTIKLDDGLTAGRGIDVRAFLDDKWVEDFSYVILDDSQDYLYFQVNNFIHINSGVGLTKQNSDRAIKILSEKAERYIIAC